MDANRNYIMNDLPGYIKYMVVAMIPAAIVITWSEVVMTGGLAVLAGFFSAFGGFIARLLTNWMKRRWDIFRLKK